MTPNDEVLRKVRMGEEVVIGLRMPAKNIPAALEYISKNEKIMDELIYDFKENKFDYNLPDDFVIYSEDVGITEVR